MRFYCDRAENTSTGPGTPEWTIKLIEVSDENEHAPASPAILQFKRFGKNEDPVYERGEFYLLTRENQTCMPLPEAERL
jgi:hypothetical protein